MIKSNDEKSRGACWVRRGDPVFEVDFGSTTDYPNGDRLPGIWISEPVPDTAHHSTDMLPVPVVSPWNQDSGYLPKNARYGSALFWVSFRGIQGTAAWGSFSALWMPPFL